MLLILPLSFGMNANFSINFVEWQVYQEDKYCDKSEIALCKHTQINIYTPVLIPGSSDEPLSLIFFLKYSSFTMFC